MLAKTSVCMFPNTAKQNAVTLFTSQHPSYAFHCAIDLCYLTPQDVIMRVTTQMMPTPTSTTRTGSRTLVISVQQRTGAYISEPNMAVQEGMITSQKQM